MNVTIQGISRPPCLKSEEYLWRPVTVQQIDPFFRNRAQARDTVRGK